MAYSEKLIDHYENPRNIGSFDKGDAHVGTGLVGAPSCGDVMKLQIKVSPEGLIEDAKFKTFGCFGGNTPINTPTKVVRIKDLKAGDDVLSWNGKEIISNKVKEVVTRYVDIEDLLIIKFQRESHRNGVIPGNFRLICTKEHVFWNANNQPILAEDLVINQELYEITEYELRKRTNVRHRNDLKQKNSKRMKIFNQTFDHSLLPQNQKGYICKDANLRKQRQSAAAIRKWNDLAYIEKWKQGMSKIDRSMVTSIEQAFIDLFEKYNMPVKYSAGKIWIQTKMGPASPDFIVPGKKKCIEVYTKNMPKMMEDRSETSDYVGRRTAQLKTAGYDTLCVAIEDIETSIEKIQNFIHNGIKVISIKSVTHGNELRGVERNLNRKVKVYDLKLEDGAHVYFANRVGSHNCGSAIASSSLVTEWVKGKTLEEAETIKNTQIAQYLALPPVKIHCSVLAEDAIKAAIADYRKKQESNENT